MRKVMSKKISLFILILTVSVIAQVYSVSLIFGITLSFAPVLYLASIRVYGFRFALLLTICMSILTNFLHIGNSFVFLSILEVLIIGTFYTKKGKDLFTWSFVYSFIVFLFYFLMLFFFSDVFDGQRTLTNFMMLQSVTASLFAALVADMLCDYLPLVSKSKSWFHTKHQLYFGQVISHILIFSAVFPLLIIILVNGRAIEKDMYQEYYLQYQQLEERLQLKVAEMDSTDIQNYELDAELEKARIKSILDEFTGTTNKQIYIIDQDYEIWLDTNIQNTSSPNFDLMDAGFVKDIHPNGFIWLPSNQQTLSDWYQGYYIGETAFLNKRVLLIIPISSGVLALANGLNDYLIFALLVLFIALVFGMLVNRILSNSLRRLTQVTSDLPGKMKRQEAFYWKDTAIDEFSKLGQNIEKVACKLQAMFADIKKKNDLLTAKTNQLIESESKLYHLAHFDTLTELPNRYSFHMDVTEMLDEQVKLERFVIVFIDLDKFKQVNDTLGHSGGDLLLKLFAKRLKQFERDEPVTFYRLAGDEFVAIVELTTEEEVQSLCKQLVDVIIQPIKINKTEIKLTASIGISFYPDNGITLDELLHHADSLMYEEKKHHHDLQDLTTYREEND
ncbi:diguanylate cyclase [Gracilibacillus salitolerans]|uniref:Diguanylate cyclase n=1 Tax=Gracilibacillus salitolerans TaxID=2663022 RepID=A0A5Q2TL04_9BACI|nr:sensor domain-containing diguanylate cyclase [Gracilibacillus salitolerans]QGH35436.1 diguanylate cyclase [Gracilibacillus salitolerans]